MSISNVAVLEPGYASYETEKGVLSDTNARVVPVAPSDDVISSLRVLDPVGVMVRESAMTPAVIDSCPNLKVIVRYGVGVDNVDIPHATGRGIYVANVPDYGAEIEVSEHAVALYLAVQRRLLTRDAEVRQGKWDIGQKAVIPGREKAVLGLVGGGRIGLETARKFGAFGFSSTLVYDPFLEAEVARAAGVKLVSLEELCRSADVVSLHAPLTESTRHIIDAEHLALMKRSTILVNVSRGGLVDETALAKALHAGRIFGAGIDVFEQEPVRENHPLLTTPNTILSDHAAWYSERSVEVLQRNAAQEVRRVLTGQTPKNWVNQW